MKSVLVDTSVWVAHFREHNHVLADLLAIDSVVVHPLVIGEIACGTPPERTRTLSSLMHLRQARQPALTEVLVLIERHQLYGLGCGLIDINLLATSLLQPGMLLWTLDKRLAALSSRFGIAFQPEDM